MQSRARVLQRCRTSLLPGPAKRLAGRSHDEIPADNEGRRKQSSEKPKRVQGARLQFAKDFFFHDSPLITFKTYRVIPNNSTMPHAAASTRMSTLSRTLKT